MNRKETVVVRLNKDLFVELTGTYFGGYIGSWEQPPEDSEFEVDKVELHTGSLTDLIEYIDGIKGGIFEHFSEKAVEQIQQDKYEAKADRY